jgi:hypothetical protein
MREHVQAPAHVGKDELLMNRCMSLAPVVQAAEDGEYRLRIRTASRTLTNATTTWRLTIDSTPPAIAFDTEPPTIVLADSVLMKVRSEEEGTQWACALFEGNVDAVDAALLRRCAIAADGAIEYGDLKDGSRYTFAIRATDAFENTSPVATRLWLVDSSPPRVYGSNEWPEGTRATAVTLRFGVSDGPAGAGVAKVECGVRWLGAAPQTAPAWGPCKRATAAGATAPAHEAAQQQRRLRGRATVSTLRRLPAADEPCGSGCQRYEQALNTTDQGVWGFTVRTADSANQTFTSEEAKVVVDRVAPQAAWPEVGRPRNPSPPVVTVELHVDDPGPYKSRIRGVLCALHQASRGAPGAAFRRQAESSVLLAGSGRPAPAAIEDFSYKGPDGEGELAGEYGRWHVCAQPLHFSGLASGVYTLRAKPLDAAGNAGGVIQMQLTINARLDPNDPIAVNTGKRSIGVVTGALIGVIAAALVLGACVAAVLASRRRSAAAARRAAAHDAVAAYAASLQKDSSLSEKDSSGGAASGLIPAEVGCSGDVRAACEREQRQLERFRERARLQAATQALTRHRDDKEAVR